MNGSLHGSNGFAEWSHGRIEFSLPVEISKPRFSATVGLGWHRRCGGLDKIFDRGQCLERLTLPLLIRQTNCKLGALSDDTRDGYFSVLDFYKLLNQCQAYSHAAILSLGGGVRLPEAVKNKRQLLLADARPTVTNFQN